MRFRTKMSNGQYRREKPGTVVSTGTPQWMRELWRMEGRDPRTGQPMTQEEKQQIDENDGSIVEGHGNESSDSGIL